MRVGNVDGRLSLMVENGHVDVEIASGGRFTSDPQAVYDQWGDFTAWAGSRQWAATESTDESRLGAPVPRPRQVFAVGLNYAAHAAEGGRAAPASALVFTKFPTCISGPYTPISIKSETVDWEVELVVVIGRGGSRIAESDAWDHVAGVTVGQDVSDRTVQHRGSPPQFSLGKSFAGYGPIGPWLITTDELENRDDLELRCSIDGQAVQKSRTSLMIHGVPKLIADLSEVCELLPGDLIFTGTPDGVGVHAKPQRFLRDGNVLTSWIEGIGEMRNVVVVAV